MGNMKMLIGIFILFGFVIGLIMIAYEDGIPFGLSRKMLCRLNRHKMVAFGIKKYYCEFCKKPRTNPSLTVIDGDNKRSDNKYRF
jgi:hypothetical protein